MCRHPFDLSSHPPGRSVNRAKAERELGARSRPLDETLRDVVAWYRAHP